LTLIKTELYNLLKSNSEIQRNEKEITDIKIKTINDNIIMLKDIIEKQTQTITSNIITQFYEIKKSNIEDISLLFDKKSIDNTDKLITKIEKENNNLIMKSSQIIQEIIPKTNNIYYERYNEQIKSLKEDINKNILNAKCDMSLDKMKILIRENYDNFINSVQDNLIKYLSLTEERIKTDIEILKTDK